MCASSRAMSDRSGVTWAPDAQRPSRLGSRVHRRKRGRGGCSCGHLFACDKTHHAARPFLASGFLCNGSTPIQSRLRMGPSDHSLVASSMRCERSRPGSLCPSTRADAKAGLHPMRSASWAWLMPSACIQATSRSVGCFIVHHGTTPESRTQHPGRFYLRYRPTHGH